MATKYNTDSIVVIKSDRERVQQSPNMYVPNRSTEGAIHCYFEIIDNSIDELTVPGSIGNKLKIYYDGDEQKLTVEDDGRGIPLEKLRDVITVLASSGKFNNNAEGAYLASGGAFGHGATVCWALSDYYSCTSTRDGKALTYTFTEDKKGLHEEKTEVKSKGHGTITTMKLNPKYVDGSHVTPTDIINRLKEKSYVFPDLKIELTVKRKGKETTYTYGGKDITDRIKEWKLMTPVMQVDSVEEVTYLKNITDDKLTTEKVKIHLAFAYSEDAADDDPGKFLISYVNTIKTYAGGMHVEGLKAGIQKFFKNKVIPNLKGKDKEMNILPSDMTTGLCAFVVVSLSSPEFRGQEKTQLSNQEVRFAVRDAVYNMLMELKPNEYNHMVDFVKRTTKGRMASKKVRKKDVSNPFSKDHLRKFKDIIYNLETTDTELILVEG